MRKQQRLDKLRARQDQLVGEIAVDTARIEEARRKAIADEIDGWLETLSEPERTRIFDRLEAGSSVRNRKLIQDHPLRPAGLPAGGVPGFRTATGRADRTWGEERCSGRRAGAALWRGAVSSSALAFVGASRRGPGRREDRAPGRPRRAGPAAGRHPEGRARPSGRARAGVSTMDTSGKSLIFMGDGVGVNRMERI